MALKVPLIIKVPKNILHNWKVKSEAKMGQKISQPVELVDVFPTLVDITNLDSISTCSEQSTEMTCTEGVSMKPLLLHHLQHLTQEVTWKKMAFSQYPRPSVWPNANSDQPRLKDIKIMGYSVSNVSVRYTEWVQFNNFQVNWSHVYARELYFDSDQSNNMADNNEMKTVVEMFSKALKDGWRNALPKFT